MNGYFITFEGGEGAGKTTVIHALEKKLSSLGYDVLLTREPGGIDLSEQIRKIILNPAHDAMDARTEALLYAASRRQHLIEKVIPALQQGQLVLCDRFIDSSLAYQGYARGLGMEAILTINQFAIDRWMPHKTFLLDISPEKGLQRIANRTSFEKNRLDLESLTFHQRVHEGYHKLAKQFSDRIYTIDAEKPLPSVIQQVFDQLKTFLNKIN